MLKNRPVSLPVTYYCLRFLALYAAFYVQTFFLNSFLISIGTIDLVSLIVFIVCFEKLEIFSVVFLLWASLLLQSASSAPNGFFMMYYVCSYVFICFLYRFFLFENAIEKAIVVFVLLIFKYIAIYSDVSKYYRDNLTLDFLRTCYLSVFFTMVILFALLGLYKKYEYFFKPKTW
jgi:hypothetical protein